MTLVHNLQIITINTGRNYSFVHKISSAFWLNKLECLGGLVQKR